jgi:hypothetical protein
VTALWLAVALRASLLSEHPLAHEALVLRHREDLVEWVEWKRAHYGETVCVACEEER